MDLKKFITLSCLVFFTLNIQAQQHNFSNMYVKPEETLVTKKLNHWQDLKFGLLIHWGIYSQWGIVESWSLCPEDEDWCGRGGEFSSNYYEYVKEYENLKRVFNPINFNPEKWAEAAKEAGMKYVVFTTKHHDGFCMFDTQETDYKITSPDCPFAKNPRSNVVKEVFNAFRDKGFMTGAYFSKPDWHSDYYWWRYFPPKSRNVTYEPARYPDRWNKFKNFTYNQIKELMTGYGNVDILWLDGGWVRPLSTVDTSISWQKTIPFEQDINMPRISAMAREYQPGLIIVDRTVSGEYENYVTPEQTVPKEPLGCPWESCITMGKSWSYVPRDTYKSSIELVHLLIDVVSRGGNLLLNIGPSSEGDWDTIAYQRLKEIGTWMKINGKAIYGSVPLYPYAEKNVAFTQSKDHKEKYIFLLSDSDKDDVVLPDKLILNNIDYNSNVRACLLSDPTTKLRVKQINGKMAIFFPTGLKKNIPTKYAQVIKISVK